MKKLVVIGGGFAGAKIAKSLQDKFETTLIDNKDFFEFTPSVVHTVCEPKKHNSIQTCHCNYLKKSTILRGNIETITPHDVRMGSNIIPFDILAICLGSRYDLPFKESNIVMATRYEHIQKKHHEIQQAKSILVIGGGLVGVEIAAEIAHLPGKKVTLVHSHDRLIERQPQRAGDYAKKQLVKQGVRIIFNDRVVEFGKKIMLKHARKEITADLVFVCTGIVSNSEPLVSHFKGNLNHLKQVKVNDHLQVAPHIYAAGDITALLEEKTAQNAERQADVVIQNILLQEQKKPLVTYTSTLRPMIISLGQWKGILTYKNLVLTGLLPALMKWFVEWKTVRKYR